MLKFLLDAHISLEVSTQLQKKNASIAIHTLQKWEKGRYLQVSDEIILGVASRHSLTLVTYDLRTIPALIKTFPLQKRDHAGVIFVDNKTIKSNDIGKLIKALDNLWNRKHRNDWTNRTLFLRL